MAARVEQSEIEAALRDSEGFEARDRELALLRQSHERRQGLVEKERLALEELASATDALADLGPAAEGDPAADLSGAQEELNELSRRLREAGTARRQAEEGARLVLERLERARRGAEIKREIADLSAAEDRLEESREDLRGVRDQRTEAKVEIGHQERHRETAGESGVCPTCHRDLEGAGKDLIAGFDAAIATARRHHKALDRKIGQLEKATAKLEREAQRESPTARRAGVPRRFRHGGRARGRGGTGEGAAGTDDERRARGRGSACGT